MVAICKGIATVCSFGWDSGPPFFFLGSSHPSDVFLLIGLVLRYFISYKWDEPLLTPHNWAELDPAGQHVDAGCFVKWEELIQHLPCILMPMVSARTHQLIFQHQIPPPMKTADPQLMLPVFTFIDKIYII